jgi:predicted aspartyl protease
MIVGHVNSRREAIIQLAVLGERNQRQGVKAIIDTGYTGFLTCCHHRHSGTDVVYAGRGIFG